MPTTLWETNLEARQLYVIMTWWCKPSQLEFK